MAKEGSAISGLMDSFATAVSIMLQYGVPLEVLVNKFSNSRFEPSGFTSNQQIPIAKSVMDYIFRWLAIKFMGAPGAVVPDPRDGSEADPAGPAARAMGGAAPVKVDGSPERAEGNGGGNGNGKGKSPSAGVVSQKDIQVHSDAPPCADCGSVMEPNGTCYRCLNCGGTSGCS
jgi:ribonucleoside-diphosphate reductase alpha chain